MFFKPQNSKEISITISNRTFFRLALLTVVWVVVVSALKQATHSLLLISCAFFLAMALNGPVHWVAGRIPGKRKGSRTLATAISFLVVIAFLGLFLASMVPPLVKQTGTFLQAAPSLVKDFTSQDSATGRFIRDNHLENEVNKASAELSDRVKGATGKTFSTLQTIGSSLFSVLAIVVLTFMMLIEGPHWVSFAISTFPKDRRADAKRIANEMYKVVKGFVNGQVTLAALAAVLILPAILLLHIGYPAALVVIIFICGLIPLVGHTIGALIVTTVALFESTSAGLIILSYYILYQQLENYLIQPRIQANATNMSPLLIFLAVIMGVSFGGVFAGLFAIPLAGILRILILEYLRAQEMIDEKSFKAETTPAAK